MLQRALSKSGHRYIGFSASELAEGLNQIAVNDNNKKTVKYFTSAINTILSYWTS